MTSPDDFTLVRQAQSGDTAAFAALIKRHYMLLYKVAWQACGSKQEAEDIAQEAAIKIARALPGFQFEAAFTSWLYRLVLNTATDVLRVRQRRNTREEPLFDDAVHVSNEASPEQKMANRQVLHEVNRLSDDLKHSVILCYWHGLNHREASVVLGCSEGTVSWRLHEARKKLSHALEGGRRHGS